MSGERPDGLMFLFFIAATDRSGKIFQALKTHVRSIAERLAKMQLKPMSRDKISRVRNSLSILYF